MDEKSLGFQRFVGRVGLGWILLTSEWKFGNGEKENARDCLWLHVWFSVCACGQIMEEMAVDVLCKEL